MIAVDPRDQCLLLLKIASLKNKFHIQFTFCTQSKSDDPHSKGTFAVSFTRPPTHRRGSIIGPGIGGSHIMQTAIVCSSQTVNQFSIFFYFFTQDRNHPYFLDRKSPDKYE